MPLDLITGSSLSPVAATPAPMYGLSHFIFQFLKSVDLRPVGIELEAIPLVQSVLRWDLVLYEPHMTELKFPENSREFVIVEDWVEEPNLNDDHVYDIEEDEPLVWFKRNVKPTPKTTPQTAPKPPIRRVKTTTKPNVPLTLTLRRPRTRSVGPAMPLDLPEDKVARPSKKPKSTSQTMSKSHVQTASQTPSPSVPSKKRAPKRASPEQGSDLGERRQEPSKKKSRKSMTQGKGIAISCRKPWCEGR